MRKVIRKIVKAIMLLLSRIEIEGKENIQSGNVVYVCNHQTIFDAVIPFAFCPKTRILWQKKNCLSLSLWPHCLCMLEFFLVIGQRQT